MDYAAIKLVPPAERYCYGLRYGRGRVSPEPARWPASSALLLTDQSDRALLVKPVYKDGWELPGGVIDPGETPWEAAVREIKEELGLTVTWMVPRGCCAWTGCASKRANPAGRE